MFATTTEETRRLNAEVTHFLFPPIQQARRERLFKLILLGLDGFLLGSGKGLLCRLLSFKMLKHRSEVAHLELLYLRPVSLRRSEQRYEVEVGGATHRWILLENFLPIAEEIFVENSILSMIGLNHSTIEPSNLFRLGRKVHRLPYQDVQKMRVCIGEDAHQHTSSSRSWEGARTEEGR